MTAKTLADIEDLKRNWKNDPIWDLEKTPGFENYHDELLAFRKAQEAKWQAALQAKRDIADGLDRVAEKGN